MGKGQERACQQTDDPQRVGLDRDRPALGARRSRRDLETRREDQGCRGGKELAVGRFAQGQAQRSTLPAGPECKLSLT